jgi:mono/diheme cytochrome c family protein
MAGQYARTGLSVVTCAAMVFWIAGQASSSLEAQQKGAPKVKSVAAQPIVSIEGPANYAAYCAVCHGAEGRGDGPAAPAMKMPVPDLTTLAQRNDGKFNALAVEQTIRSAGRVASRAHGIDDMPIWGEVFRGEGTQRTTLRIGNLVKYLESIQR